MTLSEIRQRCLDRLEEESDGLRWTASALDEYINVGYQALMVRTGNRVRTTSINAVAYQFFYDLPSDCVYPMRLYRDDPLEKVWPTTYRRVDEEQVAWRSITGTRWEWYFMFGLNKLVIGPAFVTDGEAYTLTYISDPSRTELTADTDVPDFPRRHHELLVDFAVARALIVDADEARLTQAAEAFSSFQKGVRRLRKETQKHSGRVHTMREEDPDGSDFGVFP